MSKAPFMPLATDAFIGDTTGLNAAETGAYMMLLICQWRNNGQPLDNNPKKLQRMTRCTKAQFNRVWPEIVHFFEITESTISQKRVEKTMLEVLKKIQVKRESGKLGGRPKSLKLKEAVKANGYDSLKLNESKPKATINQNHKPELEKKEKEDTSVSISPQDVVDLWNKECPSFNKVIMLTGNRRKQISTRTKDNFAEIEDWQKYFAVYEISNLLAGRKGSWQATFDWALKPANMVKVLEGNYKNDAGGFDPVEYNRRKREMEKDDVL